MTNATTDSHPSPQFDRPRDRTQDPAVPWVGNLRHSTLIRRVYAGDHAAVSGQFGKWTLAAGKELPGLAKRRAAEAALYQEAV